MPDPLRIVVTGSESTGKTTLARELATRTDGIWIPEYAREYASAAARPLDFDDVEPIARGAIALQDTALATHPPIAVFDTDLVSTVVYARHYYGQCPTWIVEAARSRLADLYLLLDIDVEWTADVVRDRSDARAEIQDLFREQLREFGAAVVEIRGLGTPRLERALDAIAGHRVARA